MSHITVHFSDNSTGLISIPTKHQADPRYELLYDVSGIECTDDEFQLPNGFYILICRPNFFNLYCTEILSISVKDRITGQILAVDDVELIPNGDINSLNGSVVVDLLDDDSDSDNDENDDDNDDDNNNEEELFEFLAMMQSALHFCLWTVKIPQDVATCDVFFF